MLSYEDVESELVSELSRFELLKSENLKLRESLRRKKQDFFDCLSTLLLTVDGLRAKVDTAARPEETVHPALRALTLREREVLKLIAESHSTKEISHRLRIAFRTAVNHRSHIMAKLGIHDVAGLTRFAISTGLTQQNP